MRLPEQAIEERRNTGAPRVLVMATGEGTAAFLCELLVAASFDCTGVVSAAGTFEEITFSNFDAALVAPSGDSSEAALRLVKRVREEGEDVGIVLACPSRGLGDLVQALRLGIVDYLCEPLEVDQLADAVQRAVDWGIAVRSARRGQSVREQMIEEAGERLASQLRFRPLGSSLSLDRAVERLYRNDLQGLEYVRRVAAIAAQMAGALLIGDPLLGDIWRAALAHDAGSIVLPRPQSPREEPSPGRTALARARNRAAVEALARVPFLAASSTIVAALHERYDGTGWPLGLHGQSIPLGARVIAAAQVFEQAACGSPEEHDRANAELVRHAGSRLDPDVVAAWLRAADSAPPVRC
jgi:response regulator RpfG family c-di-GMP phosphodiesterase